MSSTKILLFIAFFFLYSKASKYFRVVKNVLNFRYRKASGEIKHRSELPDYLEPLVQGFEDELKKLGFTFSHLCLVKSAFVSVYGQQWNLVYYNCETNCYASVIVSSVPKMYEPVGVEFSSFFADQSFLTTYNGAGQIMIGELPNAILNDPCTSVLEQQYLSHIQKLHQFNLESVELSDYEYLENDLRIQNEYIDDCLQKGYFKPCNEMTWQVRMLPAIKYAFGVIKNAKAITTSSSASLKALEDKGFKTVAMPIEVEVDAHLYLDGISSSADSGMGWKFIVFFVSLAIGGAIWGTLFSVSTVLFVFLALIVHELGHYIAMLVFGYRDRQIFFMPFGAVTHGKKDDASFLQEVVVFLSGPALGLIAGAACIIGGGIMENESVMFCGMVFLFLNYLNLLPIVPLDGGGLFELVLFSRVPVLKTVFYILSLVVVAVGAIWFRDPFLIVFSIIMLLGVRSTVSVNSIHSRFKKQIKMRNVQRDKESILTEIFTMLKQKEFSQMPFEQKYQISKSLLSSLMQQPPKLASAIIAFVLFIGVCVLPVLMILSAKILMSL